MVSWMAKPEETRASFEAAYDELLEPLFRYFLYRLEDRDRARELAQETFMKAWAYLASGREVRAMRPFLYTTAGNLFKNELRAKRPAVSLERIMEKGFDVGDDRQRPERLAEARLLAGRLDELNPRYREILLLRYADGLSNREIAAALGKSESAVAVTIHRALAKLRALHDHHA